MTMKTRLVFAPFSLIAVGLVGALASACDGDDNAAPEGSGTDAGVLDSSLMDAATDAGDGRIDANLPTVDSSLADGGLDATIDVTVTPVVDASTTDSNDAGTSMAADGARPDSSSPDAATSSPDAATSSPDAATIDGAVADGMVWDAADAAAVVATNIVYVETNDTTSGANAIWGYSRAVDGSLTPLAGSPFSTGGTGIGNPQQMLGPDDSDQELVVSADHTLLFAVNSGSNTIAVLSIHADGSLTPVAGSPFASGGVSPVSVGLAGKYLYVVNQDGDPAQDAASGFPNYTGFSVGANGALTPVANSTVAAGASPSVALVSPHQNLLFGADFLAPLSSTSAQGPLRVFTINANGSLTSVPGTPMAIPTIDAGVLAGTSLALGLAVHPTQNALYVGFVLRNEVGVYSFDGDSGALSYDTEVPLTGSAPCWLRLNAIGNRIYVTDTASNAVSVLDATNPLAPTEIQELALKDPGPLYANTTGQMVPTSQAYQEALSPNGTFLYVLSQRTTTDATVSTGNVLHIVSVAVDGTVSEPLPDVKLVVPIGVRPQGLVVL